MYTIITILLFVGMAFFIAGFIGNVGVDNLGSVETDAAAALAMLVIFLLLVVSCSSFSELTSVFETICGKVPLAQELTDYGTLRSLFHSSALKGAAAFLDVVTLGALIEIICLFPLTRNSDSWVVKLFGNLIICLVALFVLNSIIKYTKIYQWLVKVIGAIISFIAAGSIPTMIRNIMRGRPNISPNSPVATTVVLAGVALFMEGPIAAIFRKAFFKAIAYIVAILFLEWKFGALANVGSYMAALVIAFVPVVIMLIAIVIMLRSVFPGRRRA